MPEEENNNENLTPTQEETTATLSSFTELDSGSINLNDHYLAAFTVGNNSTNYKISADSLKDAFSYQNKINDPGFLTLNNISDTVDRTIIKQIAKYLYPVGSFYWNINDRISNKFNPEQPVDPTITNLPEYLFGGYWIPIKDVFLWAKGIREDLPQEGEIWHTLTESEMPTHTHNASSGIGTYDPGTRLVFQAGQDFAPNHVTGYGPGSYSDTFNKSTNHTHEITVDSAGSSQHHNNMPPYQIAYCWMKLQDDPRPTPSSNS